MPSDEDIIEFEKQIKEDRKFLEKLSIEELAAIDIAQQIRTAEFQIEMAQETIARLKPCAKKLPKPNSEDVSRLNARLIKEEYWRFRGNRDLQRKLYGWD